MQGSSWESVARFPGPEDSKKGAHWAPELFAFRLCRLGHGDGLARVANFEARETPHRDVLAQLADLGRNELRDRDGLVLNEGLLQQANLFVELFHLAGDHLLRDIRRLAAGNGLGQEEFLLAVGV